MLPSGKKRHTSKNLYGSEMLKARAQPTWVVVDHMHWAAELSATQNSLIAMHVSYTNAATARGPW